MPNGAKSELKHLPLMACKAFGGIMTAVGIFAAVFIYTRAPGKTVDIIISLFSALIGLIVFIVVGRALKKSGGPEIKSFKESALAWLILLALAGAFILIVYLMDRR